MSKTVENFTDDVIFIYINFPMGMNVRFLRNDVLEKIERQENTLE